MRCQIPVRPGRILDVFVRSQSPRSRIVKTPNSQYNARHVGTSPFRLSNSRSLGQCSMDELLRAQVSSPAQQKKNMSSMASAQGQSQPPTASVAALSIHSTSEHSKFPNCFPSLNPVDSYRSHISELLGPVTGVDPLAIYPKLQWTQTLDKGDLMLPVPALQIKGKKPNVLAAEWGQNVSISCQSDNHS